MNIKYINKPYAHLPLKKRAIVILHLAGFSTREIGRLLSTHYTRVSVVIRQAYKQINT